MNRLRCLIRGHRFGPWLVVRVDQAPLHYCSRCQRWKAA